MREISFLTRSLAPILKDRVIAGVFAELIEELFLSIENETAQLLDIHDVDTMSHEFFLDWLAFYGITIKYAEHGQLDRNAVRRMIGLLKNRGTCFSIYSAIVSGGGLFVSKPVESEVFHWHNVPEDVQPRPEDGIIYVKTNDERVVLNSNLLEKVKPAGYKFELYFFRSIFPVTVPQTHVSVYHVRYSSFSVQHDADASWMQNTWRILGVPKDFATSTPRWSPVSAILSGACTIARYFSNESIPGHWVHIQAIPINNLESNMRSVEVTPQRAFATPYWCITGWQKASLSISLYMREHEGSERDRHYHIQHRIS